MDDSNDRSEVKRLLLEATLNAAAARPLAEGLLALRGRGLLVDASEVRHLGAQCLQVLESARLTWLADRSSFAIVASSDAFLDGVGLMGLADVLQPSGTH